MNSSRPGAPGMKRVLSPRGWAQYEPPPARSGWLELRLMPSPVLPADRMADAGGLCECRGKVGVVSVMLGSGEGPRGWLLLELGHRRYWVRLAPAGAASAPLNSPAHALYIMCPPGQPCDLSPLMALADPLRYPQYAAAAAVYAKLAEVHGFRAANHFAQHFRSPRPTSGDESVLSAALVRALAKRYGLPHEIPAGRCKADLVVNGQAVDVKICGDPNSLRRAVEDDLRRGCDTRYVVVGRCRTAVPQDRLLDIVETDAASLAYAVRMAAASMNIGSIIDTAAEALAELIRLPPPPPQPDVEKVKVLLEQLCISLGSREVPRHKLKEKRPVQLLAATLGIELRSAEDVNKVVQRVQKMEGLPYYLQLVGSTRVKCEQR